MDKQTYFRRFSNSVRWRLSEQEAREVLADYEEILAEKPEELDEAVLRDLGNPSHAAAVLTNQSVYRRWMVAFSVMAFCILMPWLLLSRRAFYHEPTIFVWGAFLVGAGLALFHFRFRRDRECQKCPKELLLWVGVLLVVSTISGLVLCGLAFELWRMLPDRLYGIIACWALWISGSVAAFAGILGLVKARLSNHRWSALYILALVVLLESVSVLALLTGIDTSTVIPNWWVPYVTRWAVLAGAGLLATGVSLC